MNVGQVQVTRRSFLKLIGALTAGAAVPGLHVQVEAPAITHAYTVPPLPVIQRQLFVPSWQMLHGITSPVLSAALHVPYEALSGTEGRLSLFWTGPEDAEVGCWADYIEEHVGRSGRALAELQALPETVIPLQTAGPEIVQLAQLGKIRMVPGQVLLIGVWGGESWMPWGAPADRLGIIGLNLEYETL